MMNAVKLLTVIAFSAGCRASIEPYKVQFPNKKQVEREVTRFYRHTRRATKKRSIEEVEFGSRVSQLWVMTKPIVYDSINLYGVYSFCVSASHSMPSGQFFIYNQGRAETLPSEDSLAYKAVFAFLRKKNFGEDQIEHCVEEMRRINSTPNPNVF